MTTLTVSQPQGLKGGAQMGSYGQKFQQSSSPDPDMLETNSLHGLKGLKVLYKNCEFHDPQAPRLPLGRGQSLL